MRTRWHGGPATAVVISLVLLLMTVYGTAAAAAPYTCDYGGQTVATIDVPNGRDTYHLGALRKLVAAAG